MDWLVEFAGEFLVELMVRSTSNLPISPHDQILIEADMRKKPRTDWDSTRDSRCKTLAITTQTGPFTSITKPKDKKKMGEIYVRGQDKPNSLWCGSYQ